MIEEEREIGRLRRRFATYRKPYLQKGGRWNEGTYAPTFKLSMSYHEEMPNILKLSTPFGRLKAMVETMAEFSEAEGEINKKGNIKKWKKKIG